MFVIVAIRLMEKTLGVDMTGVYACKMATSGRRLCMNTMSLML